MTHDCHLGFAINQRFALGRPKRPSALDKISLHRQLTDFGLQIPDAALGVDGIRNASAELAAACARQYLHPAPVSLTAADGSERAAMG